MPIARLTLASNNRAKLAELHALFEPGGFQLEAQADLDISETDEPHATFVENALAKARHASTLSGLPTLADDSGLCVDALGGAPGVHSARYASIDVKPGGLGPSREARRARQDLANNSLLLERLRGVTDRRASFVVTLVALRHAADPQPLIASARWVGEILEAPRGGGGFGYDALMFIRDVGHSVAELSAAQKGAISHRAMAAREMLELMRAYWPSQARPNG